MCGIIAAKRYDGGSVARIALKRYHKQSHRGKRGFGYVPVEGGYINRVMRFTDESDFLESLKNESASEMILHHRLPTSTENFRATTHPVVVDDAMFKYKYYLIHNGVLKNEYELYNRHKRLGLEYNTLHRTDRIARFQNGESELVESSDERFLDSEALAKDFALYVEGKQSDMESEGSIAFICYQTEKDGGVVAMYYGANSGNPIMQEVVGGKKHRDGYSVLKSEGSGIRLPNNTLVRRDYATGEITQKSVQIGKERVISYGYAQNSWNNKYQTTPSKIVAVNTRPLVPSRQLLPSSGEIHDEDTDGRLIELDKRLDILNDAADELQEEIINIEADIEIWRRTKENAQSSVQSEIADDEIAKLEAEHREKQKQLDRLTEEIIGEEQVASRNYSYSLS